MRSEKLQDKYAYVPRAMRAERAAAYLDISKSMFLQWVAEGKMPKGTKIGGMRKKLGPPGRRRRIRGT